MPEQTNQPSDLIHLYEPKISSPGFVCGEPARDEVDHGFLNSFLAEPEERRCGLCEMKYHALNPTSSVEDVIACANRVRKQKKLPLMRFRPHIH